jgi:hypothetical protein
MLLDWGVAELSSKPDPNLLRLVPPELVERAKNGVDALSLADAADVAVAILLFRWELLGYFVRNPTEWLEGDFAAANLGDVHVIDSPDDYKGKPTIRELARVFEDRLPNFHYEAMRERPILLGPTKDGPWCLMDGYHRCVEIFLQHEDRTLGVERVRVILGVCETARNWHNSNGRPWWP